MSPGLLARVTEAMTLLDSAFCKRYRSFYETPSPSPSPTLREATPEGQQQQAAPVEVTTTDRVKNTTSTGYPRTILDLIHLHTDDNVADLLTKAFDGPRVFNSPIIHWLRVEMVINSPWIMPILRTKELASPEQTALVPTGRYIVHTGRVIVATGMYVVLAGSKDLSSVGSNRYRDPNQLIEECPKPPRNNNQKALIGGMWSDSDKDEEEKTKDETCLVAQASNKFDPKSYEGVFLGYSQNSKAYIILNKQTIKVKESLNVTFDETPPPPKTSPLEDDDLVKEKSIEVNKSRPLGKDLEDKSLENNEIINI
nr:retrotransposon protein [Tanacetum cinerariifolium]